ncbi:MAG: hypothetical protein AAF938_18340 [Myxococcota bacterium]
MPRLPRVPVFALILGFASSCGLVAFDDPPDRDAGELDGGELGAAEAGLDADAAADMRDAPIEAGPREIGMDAADGDSADGSVADCEGLDRPPMRTIGAAFARTCALLDGALHCWGDAIDGTANVPTLVDDSVRWLSLDVSESHVCVLSAESFRCFGTNAAGQLGTGDTTDSADLQEVDEIGPVYTFSTGDSHTCAIDCAQRLHCWGANVEGQLGTGGSVDPVPEPNEIGDETWLTVGTGQATTFAVRSDGALFGWGRNTASTLGLGPGAPGQVRRPVRVGDARWRIADGGLLLGCGIDEVEDLYCWGANDMMNLGFGDTMNRESPERLLDGPVSQVSAQLFHGCALRMGELHCWGRGQEGQLADGTNAARPIFQVPGPTDWTEVVVGRFHTCGRRADESIWCAGDNRAGELGTGDGMRRNVLVQVWP